MEKKFERYRWSVTFALKEVMMLVNDTVEGFYPESEKELIDWFTWRLDDGWTPSWAQSPLYLTEQALHFNCELALAEYKKSRMKPVIQTPVVTCHHCGKDIPTGCIVFRNERVFCSAECANPYSQKID